MESTSVIIIGGGPVGLSASILLSLRHIPHILFERHTTTSIHPKACGINQRTTEIFRVMGIEDEVYAHAAPPEIASRTAWYTGFGEAGREIVSRDAWGGRQYADEYAAASASRYSVLPQIRLEPILQRRAAALNPDGIRCGAEVTDVRATADGVVARASFGGTGEAAYHAARYALVADGGRALAEELGIEWMGERGIVDMVTAHFGAAALRSLHPDPRNFITWFSSPAMGGSTRTGYLYQIGPWPRGERDEWVFVCGRAEGDPERFDEGAMVERLRRTLGLPGLPVEMLSFSHWTVNAVYAEKYRAEERVFLVGDAAHRIPPWGALGMNTGIQDVQNLVWKLEFALRDEEKYDGLLDTYEVERLEVGRRVGQTCLRNMRMHSDVMDRALGVRADASPEENLAAAAPFFDAEHPEHSAKRDAVARAQKILDSEFKAPGLEVGWFYSSVDVDNEGGETHGGQRLPDGSLNSEFYFPSTIPGHHLPHCVLERDGKSVPIRDLLPLDALALFVEEPLPPRSVDGRMRVILIGPNGYGNQSGEWRRLCGVSTSGGVLVRPDGIVAWRGELAGFSAQTWVELIDRVLHCI